MGLIPGSGRFPGERNGNPLQDSSLENSMDRGVLWVTVHESISLSLYIYIYMCVCVCVCVYKYIICIFVNFSCAVNFGKCVPIVPCQLGIVQKLIVMLV